jgi:hypothetical protein
MPAFHIRASSTGTATTYLDDLGKFKKNTARFPSDDAFTGLIQRMFCIAQIDAATVQMTASPDANTGLEKTKLLRHPAPVSWPVM